MLLHNEPALSRVIRAVMQSNPEQKENKAHTHQVKTSNVLPLILGQKLVLPKLIKFKANSSPLLSLFQPPAKRVARAVQAAARPRLQSPLHRRPERQDPLRIGRPQPQGGKGTMLILKI